MCQELGSVVNNDDPGSSSKTSIVSIPGLQNSLWALVVLMPALFQEANLFRWLCAFLIPHTDRLSRACGFYWQCFEKKFQITDENVDWCWARYQSL